MSESPTRHSPRLIAKNQSPRLEGKSQSRRKLPLHHSDSSDSEVSTTTEITTTDTKKGRGPSVSRSFAEKENRKGVSEVLHNCSEQPCSVLTCMYYPTEGLKAGSRATGQ